MKKQAGTFKRGSTRPPSDLQVRYPGVKKVHPTRAQNLCAKQFAFDDLNRNNHNYNYHYVNTATVMKSANCVTTYMLKCENCEVFADKMGTVVTDCIPRETNVPSSGYVRDGYTRCATGAVVTGIAAKRCRKKKFTLLSPNLFPDVLKSHYYYYISMFDTFKYICSYDHEQSYYRSRLRTEWPLSNYDGIIIVITINQQF